MYLHSEGKRDGLGEKSRWPCFKQASQVCQTLPSKGAFINYHQGVAKCLECIALFSQVYIPKRRSLIQVLPPLKLFRYLLMHMCILSENCN